jgi:(2R)-sulfolactate sulfo-lyase subunit alpha
VLDIAPGERVRGVFMDDNSSIEVEAKEQVPLGHKIAIAALDAGADLIEYGVRIGKTTSSVKPGVYVHIHNLKSARW